MIKKAYEFFFAITILFFSHTARATNYYLSATGNDVNAGTSIVTAWETIGKLNSSFSSFSAGDSILFKRGDTFYGTIVANKGGTLALPIVIGAYGTGAKPIITGFKTATGWKNLGNNIWESTSAVSALTTCNIVVVSGVNTAMGRYPNAGYLSYGSLTPSTITNSSLNSSVVNWTGAIAVIRKNNWITDKDTITAQSAGTLTHTSHSIYKGIDNYGFFIQNDRRTLDQENEWYFDASTKKLQIYSTRLPANVQVPTIDTLVNIYGRDNIVFNNISFEGANKAALSIKYSSRISIVNCDINFSGIDAIITRGGGCNFFGLVNSTINHTNNNAIDLGGKSPNCLISHNTIKNTGMLAGMGLGGDGNYVAIQVNSDNTIVENCSIDSTGYNGIVFHGNNTIVRNNFLSNYCMTKFDGGGIYTFIGIGGKPATGQKIFNNIVINGVGNVTGTSEKIPLVHGIYLDEGTANVEIAGNTSANNSHSGLYYHSSYSNNVHDNTLYNNNYCQFLMADYNSKNAERNLKFKGNILVSKTSTQTILNFQSRRNDIASFGIPSDIDNNYYLGSMDNKTPIETISNNYGQFNKRNFADWQSYSRYDQHSVISMVDAMGLSSVRLEYNSTYFDKVINLNSGYFDVNNISHSGRITLAPYTSVVLMKKE